MDSGSVRFDDAIWKAACTSEFQLAVVNLNEEEDRKNVMRTVLGLMRGFWRGEGTGNVSPEHDPACSVSKHIQKVSGSALFLGWNVDLLPMESDDGSAEQIIKFWDVIEESNLHSLDTFIEATISMYTTEFQEHCHKRVCDAEGRTCPAVFASIPKVWVPPEEQQEQRHSGSQQRHSKVLPPGRVSSTFPALLILKWHPLSVPVALELLAGKVALLPFYVSPEEHKILEYPESAFVLGRSGTGKTTVIVHKLLRRHLGTSRWNMRSERRCLSLDQPTRQIILTRSPHLCKSIRKYLTATLMTLKELEGEDTPHEGNQQDQPFQQEDPDHDEEDEAEATYKGLPEALHLLPSAAFPLVLDFRKFLDMLNASLHKPFTGGQSWRDSREVTYERFCSKYWHDIGSGLKDKVDAACAFTEITSHIKGSLEAIEEPGGCLTADQYVHLACRRVSILSHELRRGIYAAFAAYERRKRVHREWDLGDMVHHMYTSLAHGESFFHSPSPASGPSSSTSSPSSQSSSSSSSSSSTSSSSSPTSYNSFPHPSPSSQCRPRRRTHRQAPTAPPVQVEFPFDEVYVDEVQDLTQAQLALLRFVCRYVQTGFLFAGDTAQTIARGVQFRFQDIRKLFYHVFLGREDSSSQPGGSARQLPDSRATGTAQRRLTRLTSSPSQRKSSHEKDQKFKGSKATPPPSTLLPQASPDVQVPDLFALSQNFRSHQAIVGLAASVVQLLQTLFPLTVDHLPLEFSHVPSPTMPLVLQPGEDAEGNLLRFLAPGNGVGDFLGCTFGAQQAILVRDEGQKAKLLAQASALEDVLLTIDSCKGLEFKDVLVLNFFQDSPLRDNWACLDTLCRREAAQMIIDAERNYALCSELKHLYVALTRARERVWIFDCNAAAQKPLLRHWLGRGLVRTSAVTRELLEGMARGSTEEEWRERGFKMMHAREFASASRCFRRAQDPKNAELATACDLQKQAEELPASEAAQQKFVESAELFLSCGKKKDAAKAYFQGGRPLQAGEVFCSRIPPDWLEAAECFAEGKDLTRAAQCFVRAGKAESALDCFMEASRKNTDVLEQGWDWLCEMEPPPLPDAPPAAPPTAQPVAPPDFLPTDLSGRDETSARQMAVQYAEWCSDLFLRRRDLPSLLKWLSRMGPRSDQGRFLRAKGRTPLAEALESGETEGFVLEAMWRQCEGDFLRAAQLLASGQTPLESGMISETAPQPSAAGTTENLPQKASLGVGLARAAHGKMHGPPLSREGDSQSVYGSKDLAVEGAPGLPMTSDRLSGTAQVALGTSPEGPRGGPKRHVQALESALIAARKDVFWPKVLGKPTAASVQQLPRGGFLENITNLSPLGQQQPSVTKDRMIPAARGHVTPPAPDWKSPAAQDQVTPQAVELASQLARAVQELHQGPGVSDSVRSHGLRLCMEARLLQEIWNESWQQGATRMVSLSRGASPACAALSDLLQLRQCLREVGTCPNSMLRNMQQQTSRAMELWKAWASSMESLVEAFEELRDQGALPLPSNKTSAAPTSLSTSTASSARAAAPLPKRELLLSFLELMGGTPTAKLHGKHTLLLHWCGASWLHPVRQEVQKLHGGSGEVDLRHAAEAAAMFWAQALADAACPYLSSLQRWRGREASNFQGSGRAGAQGRQGPATASGPAPMAVWKLLLEEIEAVECCLRLSVQSTHRSSLLRRRQKLWQELHQLLLRIREPLAGLLRGREWVDSGLPTDNSQEQQDRPMRGKEPTQTQDDGGERAPLALAPEAGFTVTVSQVLLPRGTSGDLALINQALRGDARVAAALENWVSNELMRDSEQDWPMSQALLLLCAWDFIRPTFLSLNLERITDCLSGAAPLRAMAGAILEGCRSQRVLEGGQPQGVSFDPAAEDRPPSAVECKSLACACNALSASHLVEAVRSAWGDSGSATFQRLLPVEILLPLLERATVHLCGTMSQLRSLFLPSSLARVYHERHTPSPCHTAQTRASSSSGQGRVDGQDAPLGSGRLPCYDGQDALGTTVKAALSVGPAPHGLGLGTMAAHPESLRASSQAESWPSRASSAGDPGDGPEISSPDVQVVEDSSPNISEGEDILAQTADSMHFLRVLLKRLLTCQDVRSDNWVAFIPGTKLDVHSAQYRMLTLLIALHANAPDEHKEAAVQVLLQRMRSHREVYLPLLGPAARGLLGIQPSAWNSQAVLGALVVGQGELGDPWVRLTLEPDLGPSAPWQKALRVEACTQESHSLQQEKKQQQHLEQQQQQEVEEQEQMQQEGVAGQGEQAGGGGGESWAIQ